MNIRYFIAVLTTIISCNLVFADGIGSVTVNNSAEIDSLVYKTNIDAEQSATVAVTTSGYRVQIFSSNRNQIAKAGAFKLQSRFLEVYPDVHTYVTYTAPFWKVRVGDFTTYYEALNFSNDVKNSFPERATEIFVVKEDVVKPIYLKEESKSGAEEKDNAY